MARRKKTFFWYYSLGILGVAGMLLVDCLYDVFIEHNPRYTWQNAVVAAGIVLFGTVLRWLCLRIQDYVRHEWK